MNVQNRILSVILAALLLAPALCACSPANDPADGTSTPPSTSSAETTAPATETETEPPETEPVRDTDDLPAELNGGGYKFRICSRQRDFFHSSWLTEDTTGNRLNDALYDRQTNVGKRLNVELTEELVNDTTAARNSILTFSDDFDLINTRCSTAWEYAAYPLFFPLDQLKYIDLDKSYWDKNLNDAMTVGGKAYFATGASNITAYDFTHALLFNKDMITDKNLENPYELVTSGKWTLDKFAEMIDGASDDLNGDGVMDQTDAYGYLSQPKSVLPCLWIASGILSIEKDAKDMPVFTLASNEKFTSLFTRAFAITYDSGDWYQNKSRDNSDPVLLDMFQTDRGLFYATTFFYIEKLREMETDFGVLPYPKYDETQKNYLSRVEGVELSGVPLTVPDTDLVSAVIEALASESGKKNGVTDSYYEITLKTQAARDAESSAMLDLIFANRVFDLGDTIWCDILRDGVFEKMFLNNDRNLTSNLESVTGKLNKNIEHTTKGMAKGVTLGK